MTLLPKAALQDLKIMESYFEPENGVLYESDLIDQYGQDAIWGAIEEGILEHRRLPFSSGRHRCICWSTPKGRALADS